MIPGLNKIGGDSERSKQHTSMASPMELGGLGEAL